MNSRADRFKIKRVASLVVFNSQTDNVIGLRVNVRVTEGHRPNHIKQLAFMVIL